ncbi:hypothetical protein AVEN_259868-1 [Araneus ventricosus]|uniref:Uncharacterized protein n=1 Tax=Araneus ventricosus TaxID=182803 RepID=A0A4Y2DUK9_ARAVE|nr:hypothetical protein AVEN_259868-1 [Araneus ventricosus]
MLPGLYEFRLIEKCTDIPDANLRGNEHLTFWRESFKQESLVMFSVIISLAQTADWKKIVLRSPAIRLRRVGKHPNHSIRDKRIDIQKGKAIDYLSVGVVEN